MREQQWRDIRRRHAAGTAIKAIARDTGLSRNTIRRALGSDVPPGSLPRPARTPDADDRAIVDLLVADPELSAPEIGRRIGWTRSATALRDRVRAARRAGTGGAARADLPLRLTTFVGREQEVAAVRRALDDRLVSLVGPGGVGKTRLAYQAVGTLGARYPDGIRILELASLRDPDLLLQTVLDGLGVPGDDRDRTTLLLRHLQGRRLLLVLDNCEHLVDAVAALVGAILAGTRDVTILLTSRQGLGIGGEHVVEIAPLASPGVGDPAESDVEAARGYPAVALFVDRATTVLPGFVLDGRAVTEVVEICRELDGVPLALELAAVRLNVLSLRQLRDRLPDRFALLTGGDRTGPARHRTLEATISWSFDLCTAVERAVWIRASVFTGTFDLDAVEQVCAYDGLAPADVVDGLSGLSSKSLVVRRDDAVGDVRFGQLETIRGYGQDRLDTELGAALRRRHRDRQLRLVRALDDQWCGPDQRAWCRWMRAERADLRAALDFCLQEPGERPSAAELAGGSFFLWAAGLSIAEHRRWLDLALAAGEARTTAVGRALAACSLLAALQGDQPAGADMAERSRSIAAESGDQVGIATATHMAGLSAFFSDEFTRAHALFVDAEARYRDLVPADSALLVALEVQAGLLAISQGDLDRAAGRMSATAQQCADRGDQWFRGYTIDGLGFIALLEGRTDDARRHSAEALTLAAAFDDAIGLSLALDLAAWTAAADDEHERAAALLGAASARWTSFGRQLYGSPDWQKRRMDFHERALSHLGGPAFDAANRHGASLSSADAVVLALDRSTPIPGAHDVLTQREREVAVLVTGGLTNREIAARLVLSPRTVEGHVGRAIAKLGFSRRAQLAAWASRRT